MSDVDLHLTCISQPGECATDANIDLQLCLDTINPRISPITVPPGGSGINFSTVPPGDSGSGISPGTVPPGGSGSGISPSTVPRSGSGSGISPSTVPPGDQGSGISPSTVPPGDSGSGISPSTVPPGDPRVSLSTVPPGDSGINPSAMPFDDPKISHNAAPPSDLGLNHGPSTSPTTNGSLTQETRTGFKSGKVSPSPVESAAASPTQRNVRKGAWERAQEQFEAEELQAQQDAQGQPLNYDTNFALSEKHFSIQKVGITTVVPGMNG